MAKTRDFYVIDDGGEQHAVTAEQAASLCKQAKLDLEAFATLPGVTKCHLVFKLASYRHKAEVQRASQVADMTMGGFRFDPDALPVARMLTLLESWSFGPLTREVAESLPYAIGEFIEAALQEHLYPVLRSNSDFFTALDAKSAPSSEANSAATA